MGESESARSLGVDAAQDVLMHYGKKGMRWGVRKAPETGAKQSAKSAKQTAKAEKKWDKQTKSFNKGLKAYNKTADEMNKVHIDRINNKPQYKDKDFTNDSPLRRKYYKEYETTFNDVFNKNLKAEFGTSPSGKHVESATNIDDGLLPAWKVVDKKKVQHADEDISIEIEFVDGKIVAILPIAIEHNDLTNDIIDDILVHYGKKGMRWGVRNSKPSVSKGKAGKPKSEDAKKAKSIQAKAKKSGLDSLSNDELKVLVNRMQLESNYKTVKAKNLSGGKAFAKQTVKEVGKKTTNELLGKALSAGIGAATAAFLAKKAKRAVGG